jgi:hypothetical protein
MQGGGGGCRGAGRLSSVDHRRRTPARTHTEAAPCTYIHNIQAGVAGRSGWRTSLGTQGGGDGAYGEWGARGRAISAALGVRARRRERARAESERRANVRACIGARESSPIVLQRFRCLSGFTCSMPRVQYAANVVPSIR